MRLKTLEMSGFKSFVDRTTVTFEDGITGVVGPNGCGKCVHGDTIVPLSDGKVLPIRTLVEEAFARAESVERMDDGEYTYDNPDNVHVVSIDTKTLKMERRPVLAFVRRQSPDSLLKITSKSGRTITATEYHPFFVHDRGKLRAIRADEIKVGTYVAAPRSLPAHGSRTNFMAVSGGEDEGETRLVAVDNMLVTERVRTKPLQLVTRLTPEWGRFLGYVISEGQNSVWSNQVRFVNSDSAVVEDFCGVSRALFGRDPVRKNYKKGSGDFFLFSSILCNLLDRSFGIKRGGHSSTKSIPALIFGAEDEVVLEFLSALIEGDGYIKADSAKKGKKACAYLEYATASEKLARGLATLLLRFGVRSIVREKTKKATNGSGTARQYFSVYVYGTENLRRLAGGLRLVSKKRELLQKAASLTEPAATYDIVPNTQSLFRHLWESSKSSVRKKHALRGRMEAYRSERCIPSRRGLSEAVTYVRQNAVNWSAETENLASGLERLTSSDIYWDEIVSIDKVSGDEWVYDLCVEKDHNFVAGDFIVHNSNIVDAIRWVMGEMSAKHLRGSEMQDVIFNGCESRAPTGMSQVFLTFDNSDGRAPPDYASYSEIQIGRRLYRSGESEYFINKTPCRLKDIIDLFLGTGVGTKAYSIVEQGMVGAIVSAKPEDRRVLIEEAAGISKFKSRKEAALRKMESTKINLVRLNDIMSELTRQINSLNRQAKKAERYQRVSEELKKRELTLAATRHRTLGSDLAALESEHARLKEAETSSSAELSGFEAELEAKRLGIAELERELDGIQQDLYRAEHAIKMAESETGHRTREQTQITQQNEVLAQELSSLKERSTEIARQIENANAALVAADLKLADSSEVVLSIEAVVGDLRRKFSELQSNCDETKTRAISGRSAASNLNSTIEHLERRHIDITGRIARNQSEIDSIDRRRAKISEDLKAGEGEIAGSRQLKLELSQGFETAVATLESQRAALAEARTNFTALRDLVADKRSRLGSLKELRLNLEGYRDGVRAVLSRTDEVGEKFKGVMGTIGELVDTDPQYEQAVGAVLGEKLQYVVVRSHEEGVSAIDYLRTSASGRGTFIPLGVKTQSSESAEPTGEGVVGPISNFVRFNDDYKQVCRHLLGDVVLVENLRRALSLWETGAYQKTFVTRDGCVVDPSGVVTGGAAAGVEEQLIAQKRRVKELEDELAILNGELAAAEGEAMKLADRVKTMEEEVEKLRRDTHGSELQMLGKERDLEKLCDEIRRYDAERDSLAVEIAALSEELSEVEREKADANLELQKCAADFTEAEARLAELQAEIESVSSEKEAKENELIEFKVALAKAGERQSSVDRELAGLLSAKTEVVLGVGRRISGINIANSRHSILTREIDSLRLDIDLAIRSVKRLEESKRGVMARHEELSSALREREMAIREIRKARDEALAGFHEVELKLTEQRGKFQYLVDGIRERYHLDLSSIANEYAKDDLDVEAEESAVAELKEKIDSIGPVNVDAIKEFEELSQRNEFLVKQNADLLASLDNLSRAIAKINRTSRQRFRDAFEAVDGKFQKLFPKLFMGGQARLMLTDEENLLETGIEIVAQPPGKKLQSITLLSGGEKALTAVALIFSIFLIKPSPFCLLDEVDAPLDDANIDRFNELIRSMTPHSQFILITHNKRTMELADLLYGVTMEEAGVSKMVSVKLGVDRQPESAAA